MLLDGLLNAKVADLGLCKPAAKSPARCNESGDDIGLSHTATHSCTIGTPRYLAPEASLSYAYDERCDVYSFALLLWQLLHQTEPFEGVSDATSELVWASTVRPPMTTMDLQTALTPRHVG